MIARLNASAQIAAGQRRCDVGAVLIEDLLHAVAAGRGLQGKALRTLQPGEFHFQWIASRRSRSGLQRHWSAPIDFRTNWFC